MRECSRVWCCRMQFPGRPAFIFGSVSVPTRETDEAVRASLAREFESVFPAAAPPILEIMPGMIVFSPDAELVEAAS